MIARYTRPEMGHIWSEENGFQKWLDVEILAAEGLALLPLVIVSVTVSYIATARLMPAPAEHTSAGAQ